MHVQQFYVDDTAGGKGMHIKASEESINASMVEHRKIIDEMGAFRAGGRHMCTVQTTRCKQSEWLLLSTLCADARARAGSKKQLPIRPTERFIYQGAVAARPAIQGQDCLVIGSNRIWVESLLLALGARTVTGAYLQQTAPASPVPAAVRRPAARSRPPFCSAGV